MLKDKNLNLVIDFLEEELNELIVENDKCKECNGNDNIQMSEIQKKIDVLLYKVDMTENIFMPNCEKTDFESIEISKLTDMKKQIVEKVSEREERLKYLSKKMKKLDRIILSCEKIKINNEKYDIENCIEKAEFCKSLIMVDSNRCKMEMEELIHIMKNVRKDEE